MVEKRKRYKYVMKIKIMRLNVEKSIKKNKILGYKS